MPVPVNNIMGQRVLLIGIDVDEVLYDGMFCSGNVWHERDSSTPIAMHKGSRFVNAASITIIACMENDALLSTRE